MARKKYRTDGKHRQVWIEVEGWDQAYIDEGIAPLIEEMWRAGIATWMSCEDNPAGYIWLVFEHQVHLEKFLNIVRLRRRGPGVPLDALQHNYGVGVPYRHDQWVYRLHVDDDGSYSHRTWNRLKVGREPDFQIRFNLHFPCTQLPEVMARLKEHNSAAA